MAERKKEHETVLLIIKLNYFSLFHYRTLDIHRLPRMNYIM